MKIDNRIFLPFAGPFAALGFFRVFWWVAGAEWSNPNGAAFVCCVLGVVAGAMIMGLCFAEEINLGQTYIGKRKND